MDLLTSLRGVALVAVLCLATAACSWMVTRWVTALLIRREILDRPNHRSSHGTPTPRGGGIGVLAVALPLMGVIAWLYQPADTVTWAALGAAGILALVSWADDVRGVPVMLRLGAHIACVVLVLALVPEAFTLFQGALPLVLDRLIAALLWVWFLNLYNFMDGIDGLAGVETAAIGAGIFAATALIGAQGGGPAMVLGLSGLVLGAAALGFLALNWHPARVFLGDVGSVPLGYLTGWLLLTLAMWGYWVAALILPAYYLADSGLTIAARALRGEKLWQAHASHFYQRAVQRGWSHGRVARFVAGGDIALMALALFSTQVVTPAGDLLCLAGAAAIVALMLLWLARAMPKDSDAAA
ncbi:MAG: glycosyltransferase family 4 protein [Alphaproteobacteria bacterium]|nr:glycosyltransferase family 4 protein [Alphaproteobacteria bacterium]